MFVRTVLQQICAFFWDALGAVVRLAQRVTAFAQKYEYTILV